ncbi:hypothetical protein AK88_04071 [Plasmodium fragile]|uniref:OTU domain-containing protein n=1 Tax=Plasmodium fragile TaxID=5857 RepID=A0A0D9QHJ8_PLAFR|nr:uncharacterized protein AK88_04071 [Plasmodium fragile]KJP86257.1 hypothetical protein AK88_04071 [Plasmodium fragile]
MGTTGEATVATRHKKHDATSVLSTDSLFALRINKEEGLINNNANDSNVTISTVVFNMADDRMYISEEHFDNVRTLQNILLDCFKSTEKKVFLEEIGIYNVKSLFYENFKNEVYEHIRLFFKFIKENFSYFTKRLHEQKQRNNLSEDQYLSNEKLQDLLEDVISYDIEKNAPYFEKLVHFSTLRKCFPIDLSANLDSSLKRIILITEIDSKKKHVHFKITSNLSAVEQQRINNTKGIGPTTKDKLPPLRTIINPTKTSNLPMKMNKNTNVPLSHYRNLCTKNNFQVASRNWVQFFHNHNETLCHVETCGSGDCLFLSLQYLLDKNGVRTTNVHPNPAVPESFFLPWYIHNVKQTDDTKFNVNDLRYLSTFYFIKFFPGYTQDYEIDEQFINEKFDLLINLEFTNYYMKKDYLGRVMKGSTDDSKNKSVLTLISNYMNKYLSFGGRPLIANTQEAAARCMSNTCGDGQKQDGAGSSGTKRNGSESGLGKDHTGGNLNSDGSDSDSGTTSTSSGDMSSGEPGSGNANSGNANGGNVNGGNANGGPRQGNNDNVNHFKSLVQESAPPADHPNGSERAEEFTPEDAIEFTSSDESVAISDSDSASDLFEEEDNVVQKQHVEDKGQGSKDTKGTYSTVTYKPKHLQDSNTKLKHQSITIPLNSNSSSSGQSPSVKIPTVLRKPSLNPSSGNTERSTPKVVHVTSVKSTAKTKNVEVKNAEPTTALPTDDYEHVVVAHKPEPTKHRPQDMMRLRKSLNTQGLLYTKSSSSTLKNPAMRLAQIESEKKYRMCNKAMMESKGSTHSTQNSQADAEESENEKDEEEESDSNKINDTDAVNDMNDYNDILEDVHEGGYRIYELIFFKLVSLSANKMTYDELKSVKKKNIHKLIGANLKSKVIGSHVFMKQITQGTILPFFNYINMKNKLNNVNKKLNYANTDVYVVVMKTTFNEKIKRPQDGLLTKSLLFKHSGDCISYWSIKNNNYHFTCDNKVIETKTIQEKATAFFYERTRTGHIHWGDETDYEGFQKMFNIGLITFINNNTKFFFPRNTFQDYPVYFLIYFYSGIHFEPSIHITVHNDQEVCRSSYDSNNIPPSFHLVPKQ